MSRTVFADRRDAGRALAELLLDDAGRSDAVVLALPRGGVPVGYEVAIALGVPLDVFLVRKLGLPGQEELAIGAIASGGVRVLNDDVITAVDLAPAVLDRITAVETTELERRERLYREGRPPLPLAGRTAILIDDGLATGSTMRAAVLGVQAARPDRIVVATPTCSGRGCEAVRAVADRVICATQPEPFFAVGLSYREFGQTTDDEVRALLAAAGAR